jgi:integrase
MSKMARGITREKFDETTEAWLTSQKKTTETAYAHQWKYFVEFTGQSGSEILASRKEDKSFYWEGKVLEFKTWLAETKKFSPYTARSGAQAARAFFSYYRLPLMFRKQDTTKMSKATRLKEDYRFSIDDFAKMFAVADLEEKYVLTAGKSFGLRAGDFLRIAKGDLEPYIDNEPPISIGEYSTYKEEVKAFPFIDIDAQPIIKLMLEKMTREGRTKPTDRMLSFQDEIQLSRTLRRVAEKAGIVTGNKQVRFHCLRKFLIDHLSSYMSESKWKQIVGKKISEGAYISPDSLREDYKRSMPEITFTKRINEDVQKVAKKEALLALTKAMGISETDLAGMFRKRKVRTIEEEIDEIEKILEEERGKKPTELDGASGTQRIVSEEDLANFLSENWKVAAVLPSGNVVIARA